MSGQTSREKVGAIELDPMDDLAARPPRFALVGPLLGILAAGPAVVYFWGFSVDDALIPARYATHVAQGLGYRFNPHGPSTDGVTPLGWAYVLAPFAAQGPLAALAAARVLGTIAWLAAAAALGAAVASVEGTKWRYASLALVLFSAPLGAWASGGLETGVVVALSTAAAALAPRASHCATGAALAGACAWLRPEMVAYAAILGAGRAVTVRGSRRRTMTLLLAVGPWCLAALTRWLIWGRPAPLAVFSKPSDLQHGAIYVLGAVVLSGAPLAALAPLAFGKLPFWPRVVGAASLCHLVVVTIAGGDWMPLARLVCPVLPPLSLVASHLLGAPAGTFLAKMRLALACCGELILFALRGPAAARVLADRLSLIEAARPMLEGATRVATIDVGWVGAATESDILDLAGATDPEVAALPGGHTSKAISGAFLTGRQPDKLVFEIATSEPAASGPTFERWTEARLAADPLVRRMYRVVWTGPANTPVRYAILSAAPASSPTSDPPPSD